MSDTAQETLSYYQMVAETLIAQLARGTAPWVKPWQPGQRFLPYNPAGNRTYRGMNVIWLLATAEQRGYTDDRWLTYRQACAAGGQVRKGERGTVIQYWQWQRAEPVLDASGKPQRDENGGLKQRVIALERPRMFFSVVFNAAQIDGFPPAAERPALAEWRRHELAEALLVNSGADIRYIRGGRAAYNRVGDFITMPMRDEFPSAGSFYGTALYALSHHSGHESRFARDLRHPIGSVGHAREELRAAIASLLLGGDLSVTDKITNHRHYIHDWIDILRNDPRELFQAAADAERIVRFLSGFEPRLQEALGPGVYEYDRDHWGERWGSAS